MTTRIPRITNAAAESLALAATRDSIERETIAFVSVTSEINAKAVLNELDYENFTTHHGFSGERLTYDVHGTKGGNEWRVYIVVEGGLR